MKKTDINKILLGVGVIAGGLILYYSRPAKDRVSVGDKVIVGTSQGGLSFETKLLVSKVTDKDITGVLIDQPPTPLGPRPTITVSKDSIIRFA